MDNPFLIGLLILLALTGGGLIGALLIHHLGRRERERTERVLAEAEQRAERDRQALLESVRSTFSTLSREALSANTDDFLKLAQSRFEQQSAQADQTLESKKKLIDARVTEIGTSLHHLSTTIQTLEKDRASSQGSIQKYLETATIATNRLQETTGQLREALANPQRRGQWGERMAEDVLRLAGFVEGINYDKQVSTGEGRRPDFTFHLPGNQFVHMDVKFPLGNYLRMLEATEEVTRADHQKQFLSDVRSRIREVTTRDYIDPAAGTVDYVLVFIPNEQIYAFIHENDRTLLDEAMKNRVVLCSPLTLYAILAVIRRAVENFRLEQGSRQILNLLGEFKKQWDRYVEVMEKMGRQLEGTQREYQNLTTTRTRMLERQLDKIEELRAARLGSDASEGLPPPAASADDIEA